MANAADKQTQAAMDALEKKIADLYGAAYRGMKISCDQFIDGYDEVIDGETIHHAGLRERYLKEHAAMLGGVYSEEEFDAWWQTQLSRSQGGQQLQNDLAQRMTNANQVAAAYINDATPSIYSLNYNYAGYEVCQAYPGSNFQLYNEQTVKDLINGENHVEFRTVSINPSRDYLWNKDQVQKNLAASILQGKNVDEVADSFMLVMQKNRTSAIRNARTAVTSAQNGGRLKAYEWADSKGYKVQKEWMAIHDARTRDSHADLDGQRVAQNKPFSNGLMYPGDPDGAPGEVYNCRCTMRAIFPGITDMSKANHQTYREWEQETLANWSNLDERQQRKATGLLERYQKRTGAADDESDIFKNFSNYLYKVTAKKTTLAELPNNLEKKFVAGLTKAESNTQQLLQKIYEEPQYYKSNGRLSSTGARGVTIGTQGDASTLAHELFHFEDRKLNNTLSKALEQPLGDDFADLVIAANGLNIKEYLVDQHPEAFRTNIFGENVMKKEYRGISDILEGLSGEMFGWGHSGKAYKNGGLTREAWAQCGRIYYDNNQEVVNLFETLFPKTSNQAIIKAKEALNV